MSERDQWLPYLDDRIAFAEQELLKEDQEKRGIIPGVWTEEDHIPKPLVDAVIQAESNWVSDAANPMTCGGGGYAQGLGQFCVTPSGSVSPSLELGDYQAVTRSLVTLDDVYDPLTAMEMTAFGLGDRYERLKEMTGKSKPRNWYLAVVGYSPRGIEEIKESKSDTKVPQAAASYIGALRDYVQQEYGESVDRQIAGESPSDTDCKWWDVVCNGKNVLGLGEVIVRNPGATGREIASNVNYWPILGVVGGIGIILIGTLLLMKNNSPMGKVVSMAT